jgi:putative GTP pyrophosphokinase
MNKMVNIDLCESRVRHALICWIRASARGSESLPSNSNSKDFPWGTKGELNRVGDKLRAGGDELTAQEAKTLDIWRASHFHVMNAFQAMLRGRTRKLPITVAQRHKRRTTIIDKLSRESGMQLARMDDVAGIRMIFKNVVELRSFRARFLVSTHKHKKKNKDDKYDYILHPRDTGYTGVHDIYSYNSELEAYKIFNGTMIEIQYRTVHQHAWATANEVVTMTTAHRTKFKDADARYIQFFKLTSEILARAFENRHGVYPELRNDELVNKFTDLDGDINLCRFLNGLNIARQHVTNFVGGVVLQFKSNGSLRITQVPRFVKALDVYFKIELENPDDDIVLVNSTEFDQLRSAYRNYFSDTTEFLSFLKVGIQKLSDDGVDAHYAGS